MRTSTFFAAVAALAASAAASPMNKRDIVYKTEYNYVTAYVYKTVAAGSPEATPAPVSSAAQAIKALADPVVVSSAPSTPAAQAPVEITTSEAPASAAPSSSSSDAGVAQVSGPSDFATKVLLHHNAHRANHSAPAIEWSSDLEASATMVAQTCIYDHQMNMNGGGYGQNIAAGPQASDIGDVLTTMFYNGEVNYYAGQYGQANPDMSLFENFGHFSQMVWAGTTHVACVTQDCTATGLQNTGDDVPAYFTVCNYASAGNMGGAWADNVLEPLGHASIDGSYSG